MQFFGFLLVFMCTLGFPSYFSSRITSFIHTFDYLIVTTCYISIAKGRSIDSFHKNISKANVEPNLQQSMYNKEIKFYSQTKEKKESKNLILKKKQWGLRWRKIIKNSLISLSHHD